MTPLRRHLAPVLALLLALVTFVLPLGHELAHAAEGSHTHTGVVVSAGGTPCDLCAAAFAPPPAPAPVVVASVPVVTPRAVGVAVPAVRSHPATVGRGPPVV